jgi:hypothetical protein
MKTKRMVKKLVLNKQTVLDLTEDKMDEIKGGITNTCISIFPTPCTMGCPASWEVKTQCDWCVP